jgi:anti-anti-sigma factor
MEANEFEVLNQEGACAVRCRGQLAGQSAVRLREQVKPLFGAGKRITVDLSDVTFMDSLGLGVVVTLYVSARTAGCHLEVVNLSQRVRDLLSVAHLLSLFEPAGQSTVKMP